MAMRFLRLAWLASTCAHGILLHSSGEDEKVKTKPNILVFIGDDIGFSDLSSYGNKNASTPNLDQLAQSGARMTQYIVAMPLCTPSRASIQTGRHAVRTSCVGATNSNRVIPSQAHPGGLDPATEISIAKILKTNGYATGMSGKWHLGMSGNTEGEPDMRYTPWAHGYETSLFAPMGNIGSCKMDDKGFSRAALAGPTNCFLVANKTAVQMPLNLRWSTDALVGHATDFLKNQAANKDKPWFFLMAFLQAHTPMFTKPENHGRSQGGEYGDNLEEMDEGVGTILKAVQEHGFYENTLVFFTSDNGPHAEEHWSEAGRNIWSEYGQDLKLKGAKGQTFEGGIRVPGIVAWPGKIPPGKVTNVFITSMDIYATAADAAGAPIFHHIDGKSMLPVLQQGAETQHPVHIHYCGFRPLAARVNGRFKLHWSTQKWYTFNPPAFDECIECCNGLNQMAWKYFGLKIGNICGCTDTDVVHHDPPIIYDLLYDVQESNVLTDLTWPVDAGISMAAVMKLAADERDTITHSGIAVPDGDGAGFCNGGNGSPIRQNCCPGCTATMMQRTLVCVDDKKEICECDLPLKAPLDEKKP